MNEPTCDVNEELLPRRPLVQPNKKALADCTASAPPIGALVKKEHHNQDRPRGRRWFFRTHEIRMRRETWDYCNAHALKLKQRALQRGIIPTSVASPQYTQRKKRLLVLDLVQTIVDPTPTEFSEACVRPHLERLLRTATCLGFDVAVWSSAKPDMVDSLVSQLNLGDRGAPLKFVLDRRVTLSFIREKTVKPIAPPGQDDASQEDTLIRRVHFVKPASLLDTLASGSTIIFVDNHPTASALNPEMTITVAPWFSSSAMVPGGFRSRGVTGLDDELRYVAKYLARAVRHFPDELGKLDHSKWRDVIGR